MRKAQTFNDQIPFAHEEAREAVGGVVTAAELESAFTGYIAHIEGAIRRGNPLTPSPCCKSQ